MKPGREMLDPLNRIVTVVGFKDGFVVVRLAGPYGATIQYPASVLREIP
jgi:hypothetical protein